MMKAPLVAFALVLLVAHPAGADEAGPLESQFRADVEAFIRAKAPQPVTKEAQGKMIEKMVADLKRLYPAVLDESTKAAVPTDEALRRAYAALARAGAGAPRPALVLFYTELWKGQRLVPRQRMIFERWLRAIAEAAAMRKKTPDLTPRFILP